LENPTDRPGRIYDSAVDQASDIKPRRSPLRRWMLVVAIVVVGLVGIVLGALEQASTPPPKPFNTVLATGSGPTVNVNDGQDPFSGGTRYSLGGAAARAPAGQVLLVPHDDLATAGQESAVWLASGTPFQAAFEYPSGILILVRSCDCAGSDTLTDFEQQLKQSGPGGRIRMVGGRIALEEPRATGDNAAVTVRDNGYTVQVSGATSIANVARVAASLQPVSSNL
jgi:hypothetical protein